MTLSSLPASIALAWTPGLKVRAGPWNGQVLARPGARPFVDSDPTRGQALSAFEVRVENANLFERSFVFVDELGVSRMYQIFLLGGLA
jgi:hypothetical protein